MDPLSVAGSVVGLVGVALHLVVGALGMIDKTVAAHKEAADELNGLKEDIEDLQAQMLRIHRTLKEVASNTKDRGFKRLLRGYASRGLLVLISSPDILQGRHSRRTRRAVHRTRRDFRCPRTTDTSNRSRGVQTTFTISTR